MSLPYGLPGAYCGGGRAGGSGSNIAIDKKK